MDVQNQEKCWGGGDKTKDIRHKTGQINELHQHLDVYGRAKLATYIDTAEKLSGQLFCLLRSLKQMNIIRGRLTWLRFWIKTKGKSIKRTILIIHQGNLLRMMSTRNSIGFQRTGEFVTLKMLQMHSEEEERVCREMEQAKALIHNEHKLLSMLKGEKGVVRLR